MGDAGAGRPETTEPARTGCSSLVAPDEQRPSPSRTTKISSSSEWQCGGALSFRGKTSRGEGPVGTAPAARPRLTRRRDPRGARRARVPSTSGDVDDVRGPRRELAHLGRADAASRAARMIFVRADRSPSSSPSHATPAAGAVMLFVEGALSRTRARRGRRPGLQRVSASSGAVDEAVARLRPRRRVALPATDRDTGAAEHVEDLLLGSFEMERSRPHAGVDLDPLRADGARCAPGEARPCARDVALLATPGARVVPVRDHTAIMSRGRRVPTDVDEPKLRGCARCRAPPADPRPPSLRRHRRRRGPTTRPRPGALEAPRSARSAERPRSRAPRCARAVRGSLSTRPSPSTVGPVPSQRGHGFEPSPCRIRPPAVDG